jgi:hypothetical protein
MILQSKRLTVARIYVNAAPTVLYIVASQFFTDEIEKVFGGNQEV